MKLTKAALDAMTTIPRIGRLMTALNCSESTIRRYLANNDDNLTKLAALAVIREETGLTDSEILEEEKEDASTERLK